MYHFVEQCEKITIFFASCFTQDQAPRLLNFFHAQLNLFIKVMMLKTKSFSCFKILKCCIYPAKNDEMPTIVGIILTFMSKMNFKLIRLEHERVIVTSRACLKISYMILTTLSAPVWALNVALAWSLSLAST